LQKPVGLLDWERGQSKGGVKMGKTVNCTTPTQKMSKSEKVGRSKMGKMMSCKGRKVAESKIAVFESEEGKSMGTKKMQVKICAVLLTMVMMVSVAVIPVTPALAVEPVKMVFDAQVRLADGTITANIYGFRANGEAWIQLRDALAAIGLKAELYQDGYKVVQGKPLADAKIGTKSAFPDIVPSTTKIYDQGGELLTLEMWLSKTLQVNYVRPVELYEALGVKITVVIYGEDLTVINLAGLGTKDSPHTLVTLGLSQLPSTINGDGWSFRLEEPITVQVNGNEIARVETSEGVVKLEIGEEYVFTAAKAILWWREREIAF
jgi:hypothetical protein